MSGITQEGTTNNTGYGINLTYGVNDRCPDGKPHYFWLHWIADDDGPWKIECCVHCGQGAESGRPMYD